MIAPERGFIRHQHWQEWTRPSGGGCICPDELVSTSKFFRTAIAVWRHRRASFRPVTAQRISSNTLLAPRLVGLRWP